MRVTRVENENQVKIYYFNCGVGNLKKNQSMWLHHHHHLNPHSQSRVFISISSANKENPREFTPQLPYRKKFWENQHTSQLSTLHRNEMAEYFQIAQPLKTREWEKGKLNYSHRVWIELRILHAIKVWILKRDREEIVSLWMESSVCSSISDDLPTNTTIMANPSF
jgi:hypothetical protein